MKHRKLSIAILVLALVLALIPPKHTAWAAAPHIVVNSTNDMNDGTCNSTHCSLREAINAANGNTNDDTIDFNITSGCGVGGVCTIQPLSALPALTDDGTTINGYSQTGAAEATAGTPAVLLIEIDGSSAGSAADGFTINSAGNVIKGLVINRFSGNGVAIYGSTATNNIVSGNHIGTDASGTGDLGNSGSGVRINSVAQNNTVGGNTAGERNVISGNDTIGVVIYGSTSNTVSGNYIGTDASGTLELGNELYGIWLASGAQSNTIGGDTIGERNVISDNWIGVHIEGSDVTNNTISGNHIGTDKDGTADLGNTYGGVYIHSGAQNNTIGGDTEGERNIISGNEIGVAIFGDGTTGNIVSGNYIGTDKDGIADLGNTRDGVCIGLGAQNNTIGGDTEGERNVISGNDQNGVCFRDSGTTGNTVSGNYIGTDESGTADLGNTYYGVYIEFGAQSNTIGPGNVIAYNGSDGVGVDGSSTMGNLISQNNIFSNTMGIDLAGGANGGIAAPVIVTTTLGSVNVVGTACAGCTVEVFENGDNDGEGETYVGNTTATASGAFTLTVSYITKPYLTATATDAMDGTSEFSEVFLVTVPLASPVGPVYLPIVVKNY